MALLKRIAFSYLNLCTFHYRHLLHNILLHLNIQIIVFWSLIASYQWSLCFKLKNLLALSVSTAFILGIIINQQIIVLIKSLFFCILQLRLSQLIYWLIFCCYCFSINYLFKESLLFSVCASTAISTNLPVKRPMFFSELKKLFGLSSYIGCHFIS